jgi:hypothetical protein
VPQRSTLHACHDNLHLFVFSTEPWCHTWCNAWHRKWCQVATRPHTLGSLALLHLSKLVTTALCHTMLLHMPCAAAAKCSRPVRGPNAASTTEECSKSQYKQHVTCFSVYNNSAAGTLPGLVGNTRHYCNCTTHHSILNSLALFPLSITCDT